MKYLQTLATASVLLVALVIGTAASVSANSLLPRSQMGNSANPDAITDTRPDIILVDRRERRQKRARANAQTGNIYGRQNNRVRRLNRPSVKRHRRARRQAAPQVRQHRRTNRQTYRPSRRRHSNSGIYIGVYPYYDPFYDYGYYDAPYYDAPSYYSPPPINRRLSCKRVQNNLRRKGYHRVRAYDCKGKVYVFYARAGGKNYRLRVNAYSGKIKSLRRL